VKGVVRDRVSHNRHVTAAVDHLTIETRVDSPRPGGTTTDAEKPGQGRDHPED
jgi:hypothetical protein